MSTITQTSETAKNDFRSIADAFLGQPGLPFADVLPAEWIAEIFGEEDAMFGEDDIITWERPVKPEWMDEETYSTIPKTLQLREIRYHVQEPGCVDCIASAGTGKSWTLS